MDYLCGDHFDGNMFYIYAYTRTDNGYADPQVDDFDCSKVVMYYNLNNSGWARRQYNTSNYYNSSTKLYQFNLLDLGMECGDTVQFYLAAERNGSSSDGDIFNNSSLYELDYALWPMYYSQPPEFTAEFINAHLAEFLDVLPYEQLNELFSHCGYSAEYLAELGYPAVRPADFPDNVLNNLLTELLAEFIYPTSNPPFTYEYTLNQTHDWTAWEVTMQSTCSTFSKESRSCNNCGATEERSLTTLNPTNHSGGSHWEEDPSATCTTAGINKLKCYGCSVVLDTNPIPATGHSMGSWYTYKDSTCHTYGTERNNCLECNYYDERSLTTYNSSNHSGGSHWEEDPSATCTTAGINKLKCYGCYAVLDTASIPETGHSMGSWYTVTASTCDTNGTKRRDCSKCSYYEEGSLDVLVHNMSAWSVTTLEHVVHLVIR